MTFSTFGESQTYSPRALQATNWQTVRPCAAGVRSILIRAALIEAVIVLVAMLPSAARAGSSLKLNFDLPEGTRLTNFELSPDSSQVAWQTIEFGTSDREIYNSSIEGRSLTHVSKTVPDVSATFNFSNSGGHLLFSTSVFDHGNRSSLYSAPTNRGVPAKVSGTVNVGPFEVAPDDSRVVFLTSSEEQLLDLYSTPLGGGAPTQLNVPLVEESSAGAFGITPDSQFVVFSAGIAPGSFAESAIVRRAIDGSDVQVRIGKDHTKSNRSNSILFTSDSSRAIFRFGNLANRRLSSASVDNSADPVEISSDDTISLSGLIDYQIAPDDSRVVFTDSVDVYSASPLGGPIARLSKVAAHFSVTRFPVITPDSSRVLYVGDLDTDNVVELYAVPIEGGESIKLNHPLPLGHDVRLEPVLIAPNDDHVVYRNQDSEIFSVEIAGGPVEQLSASLDEPGVAEPDDDLYFSADGHFALFAQDVDGERVWAVPVTGGDLVPVSEGVGIGDFRTTPDGLKVVYTNETLSELRVVGIPVASVLDGTNIAGQVAGGLGFPGGIGFTFDDVDAAGILHAEFDRLDLTDADPDLLNSIDFALSGETLQLWDISFGGEFTGPVEMTFTYDPALLGPGVTEGSLFIYHQLESGMWEELPVLARDRPANTITVEVDSFSNFTVGVVPEPSTFVLAVLGASLAWLGRRRQR